MDEQKKKSAGSGRGTGRKPGSKNRLSTANKADVSKFFRSLTVENFRWRKNVEKLMNSKKAMDPRYLRLSLEYAFGTPNKLQPEVSERPRLAFIGLNGLPWQNDPLAQREAEAIAAQQARERLEAAKAQAKPPTNAEDQHDDEEDDEGLEIVRG